MDVNCFALVHTARMENSWNWTPELCHSSSVYLYFLRTCVMCEFSVLNPQLWSLRVLKRKRFFWQDLNWCEAFYCHHPITSAAEIFIFYYRCYPDPAGVVIYWWCLFSASKISGTLNFKTYLSCKDYSLQLSTAMIYSFWVNVYGPTFFFKGIMKGNLQRLLFSFSGRMTFQYLCPLLISLIFTALPHKAQSPLVPTLTHGHPEDSSEGLQQDFTLLSGHGVTRRQTSDLVVSWFHNWNTWECFFFQENNFLQLLLMSCKLVTYSLFNEIFFTWEWTGIRACLVGLVSL